jgi:hypothetical protein
MSANITKSLPGKADLVGVAVYLASLVSSPRLIDPLLNTMRMVTSRAGYNRDQPTPDEANTLRRLCDDLVTYLVTKEQVRSFTQEDIERRIEARFDGGVTNRRVHVALAVILAAAVIVGVACFVINIPGQGDADPTARHIRLAIPSVFACITLGAAWYFHSALRYFRTNLRRAYNLVSLAILIMGIAHLQLLFAIGNFWTGDGGVAFLYVPPHILLLIGSLVFAKAMGIHHRMWRVIVPLVIVGTVAVLLAPHSPPLSNETFFDAAYGLFPLGIVTAFAAAVNFYGIAKNINDIYKLPVRYLGHASLMLGAAVAQILLLRLIFGFDNFWASYGLLMLPHFIACVLLLRAGYAFNKVSSY